MQKDRFVSGRLEYGTNKSFRASGPASNPSYAAWTNKLLICPEPQVFLICQMEMIIAPTSHWDHRVKHNNACQASCGAGCLTGIQYIWVHSDNINKAPEGVIKK